MGENDFGCVSFEILWVTFKFSTAKVCVVGVYGPIEGDNKEKGEILERLRQGCRQIRLCVLGDLNGWGWRQLRVIITGEFGVPGENDNG